jgi:uncharacterized metal-binding protein
MLPAALNSAMPTLSNATNAVVLVTSYLFSGLMFSPDLDTNSRPYKRWGPVRWLWLPYRMLVPHRHWVSHSMVVGPLLRVIYFIGAVALLFALGVGIANLFRPIDPTGALRLLGTDLVTWFKQNPVPVAYAVLGLVLGGAAHTIADVVFSRIKRLL